MFCPRKTRFSISWNVKILLFKKHLETIISCLFILSGIWVPGLLNSAECERGRRLNIPTSVQLPPLVGLTQGILFVLLPFGFTARVIIRFMHASDTNYLWFFLIWFTPSCRRSRMKRRAKRQPLTAPAARLNIKCYRCQSIGNVYFMCSNFTENLKSEMFELFIKIDVNTNLHKICSAWFAQLWMGMNEMYSSCYVL